MKEPRPHIRVKPNGRKARPKKYDPITSPERSAARADIVKVGKHASHAVVVSFRDIPRERWEQAFGRWDPEKFRRAVEAQKAARQAEAAEVAERPAVAAVHGDNKGTGRRLYRGFDWGLGRNIDGKGDRKRAMAAAGLMPAI